MCESRALRVSVVIPFYNSDSVFDECFSSVLAQTRVPDEIIVVDDCSKASSRAFLSKYADKCKIITLEENQGCGGARNIGVAQCTGDLIAFQDSDDKWAPSKLEKQIAYLEAHPEVHAVHTGVAVFSGAEVIAEYTSKPSPMTVVDLLTRSHVTPPSFVVRKSDFLSVEGYDKEFRNSGDWEFSIRFAAAGKRIDFIPEPLILVRREGHGNLSSNWLKVYRGHLKVLWKHRELYREKMGAGAVRNQLAKHTVLAGQQRGGIVGRSFYYFGKCLGFPRAV